MKKIKQVQSWAQTNLNLRKEPSYKSIFWILQNETEVINSVNSDGHIRKKAYSVRNTVLDEKLRLWAYRMWCQGVFMAGEFIQGEERRLQSSLNMFVTPEEKAIIIFSNRWFPCLQKKTQPEVLQVPRGGWRCRSWRCSGSAAAFAADCCKVQTERHF